MTRRDARRVVLRLVNGAGDRLLSEYGKTASAIWWGVGLPWAARSRRTGRYVVGATPSEVVDDAAQR